MDTRAKQVQNNLRRAEHRIQSTVCPIYGIDDCDRPQLIGSSILLRVSAHSFLITAAHVLDANRQTTLYVGGPAELAQLSGSSYRVRPPTSSREDDNLDFGFIDISDTPPNRWSRYRFVTPSSLDVNDVPAAHTLYGFVGYPETKNRQLSGGGFRLSTTAFVLVPSALERYGSLRLNPDAHFVGEFDRRKQLDSEQRLITAPDPHGISGGGVWRMGRPEEFAGGRNSEKLVGIGIEYRKSEKAIVGVRISLVVAALAKVYSELAADLPTPSRARPNITIENSEDSG